MFDKKKPVCVSVRDTSNAWRTFPILRWKQPSSNNVNRSITFIWKSKKNTRRNAQQMFLHAIYRLHIFFAQQDEISYGPDAYTTQAPKENLCYKRTD